MKLIGYILNTLILSLLLCSNGFAHSLSKEEAFGLKKNEQQKHQGGSISEEPAQDHYSIQGPRRSNNYSFRFLPRVNFYPAQRVSIQSELVFLYKHKSPVSLILISGARRDTPLYIINRLLLI